MKNLAGTVALLRLILRRDRILLPIWILWLSILPIFGVPRTRTGTHRLHARVSAALFTAFLHRDVNAELQMGAVSGLGDIDSPRAADALLAAIPQLHEKNRRLAIEGMLRTPDRRRMVADALASGALGRGLLTDEEQSKFVDEK